MKQHEREYFISRIRSGIYLIKDADIKLKIVTPTILEEFELNEIYKQSYDQALDDNFMTEEEMLEWMRKKDIWTIQDDDKIEGLKKDIEKLKVEIYNSRNNESLKETIRKYIRAGEKQLSKQLDKKNSYIINTCEGIANSEKIYAYLKMCTFYEDKIYDFKTLNIEYILHLYYTQILPEAKIRELARNDPWRSLWLTKSSNSIKLFHNYDRELSYDQKNILIWSQMYDNIQESLDCPPEDIINDDDMLDGWSILQRRKREKEKAESELNENTTNQKIKNANEVYVFAGSEKDAQRINNMNDTHGKMIKQQRFNTIQQKGEASQLDFQDERLKLAQQSNQMYKDKFRR